MTTETDAMDTHPHNARSPWLALLFSFGATGLGQIYCGRLTRGLVLFFASFAFAPIIVISTRGASSTLTFAAVLLGLVLLFAIFVFALVDSWRIARGTPADFQPREYNRWYLYLLFLVVALTYPANLAQTIRDHVVAAYKIPSTSMAPNILPGDRVLLDKTVYTRRAPLRGDVVIFPNPDRRQIEFIKRVVALPGETIAITKGIVHVNGEAITDGPKNASSTALEGKDGTRYSVEPSGEMAPMTVPHGHCFVLGDRRSDSRDSRSFGPIPLRDLRGIVVFTYWPAESWTRFGPFPVRPGG